MASNVVKWGLAGVLVFGAAIGGELLYLHHRNVLDQTVPVSTKAEYKADPDNLVFLKHEHPMSLKDEKDLKGRTLWVAAGYQMVYYPYAGHVDFAHAQGVLPPVEKLTAKDAVEAKAKPDRLNRIELGDQQVFLVFTKADEPGKEFATPVGFKQGGDYTFSTDELFYYDDPHQLFSYWGPAVWKSIDEHKATVGMTEREVYTALGQVATEQGGVVGDQTVTFDNNGHPEDVTFVNNKATKIVAR